MQWEPHGEDSVCYFRDYIFTMSPDGSGLWVYIQKGNPDPADNRPLRFGVTEYFAKRMTALDYIKRMRKRLCS